MPTPRAPEPSATDTDAALDQSARLGHQVLEQLQAMQRTCDTGAPVHGLDGHRLEGGTPINFPSLVAPRPGAPEEPETFPSATGPASDPAPRHATSQRPALPDASGDRMLEQRLNAALERHVDMLRQDLLPLMRER